MCALHNSYTIHLFGIFLALVIKFHIEIFGSSNPRLPRSYYLPPPHRGFLGSLSAFCCGYCCYCCCCCCSSNRHTTHFQTFHFLNSFVALPQYSLENSHSSATIDRPTYILRIVLATGTATLPATSTTISWHCAQSQPLDVSCVVAYH